MWDRVSLLDRPRETSPDPARPEAIPHEHVDCTPDQRRWLESKVDQAATMRPHTFCMTCGKVKNLGGSRAQALGFYLAGLSALKEHLERSGRYHKMTQSQTRLIFKQLAQLEGFDDTYGMDLTAQARIYLESVRRVRPDIEDELVLRLLPKLRRTSKKPLFAILAQTSASELQSRY